MDALVTSMATGYDPTILAVYERHNTVVVQIPAVSVELESVEPSDEGWSNDTKLRYHIVLSLRVHTAYEGAVRDGLTISRLLNSVTNKIKNNLDLGDGYRVWSVSDINAEGVFPESGTVGGQLTVEVITDIVHTQE